MRPCAILAAALLPACASSPPCRDDHPEAVAVRAVMTAFLGALRDGEAGAARWQPLLTGEARERWTRGDATLDLTVNAVRPAANGRAVARVGCDGRHRRADLYFYLAPTPAGWRIETVRGFAMTGFLEEILRLGTESGDPTMQPAVANARLVLQDDAGQRAWFVAHRGNLEALAAAAKDQLAEGLWVTREEDSAIGRAVQELALNGVHREAGIVYVSVGGLVDNEVGFLKIEHGAPPPITTDDYIWVEPLDGGWWLFRTT